MVTCRLLIGICLGLILMVGCKSAGEEKSQPAQLNNGSGQGEEILSTSTHPAETTPEVGPGGAYASQSQAMLVGGTSPYGYGTSRVVYEHKFTFTFSGGDTQLDMVIKANGFVPLDLSHAGEGTPVCDWGDYIPYHLKYTGQGKIDITGSATFGGDDEICTCQTTNKIDVRGDAITTFEAVQIEGKCNQRTNIYVKLDETWYTMPKWSCACSDPDQQAEVEQALSSMPSIPNPELKDKTLKFNYYCDGSYIDEDLADPTGIGTGRYMWTWYSGKNESADPPSNPSGLAQDPAQEPIPDCAEGSWGPALDSIMPGITWYAQGAQK